MCIRDSLSAAKTIEEAEKAFAEREKIISHVQTMSTIAYIRHTVNTLDEMCIRDRATSATAREIIAKRLAFVKKKLKFFVFLF